MTNWTTLSIREETKEHLKQFKPDGVTWDKWLTDVVDEGVEPTENIDELIERIKNEVSMTTDPTVEVDTQTIMNRIADLETELKADLEEMKR